MDETSIRVLFLVVGAVLSFIPQEISRWLQSKREAARELERDRREQEKEKRLIKQQREAEIWKAELEKFSRIEQVVSELVHIHYRGSKDGIEINIKELFHIQSQLFKYPLANDAFDRFLSAETQLAELKKASYPDGESLEKAVREAQFRQERAVKDLFAAFDEHLQRGP